MKNRILSLVVTVVAFSLLAVAPLNAQTRGKIKAEIPFEFIAGSTVLSPGTYTIERMAWNNPEKLIIRSVGNHTSAVLVVNRVSLTQSPTETDLVFNKVGERYFLRDIKVEGITLASQLPKSSDQRRLERREEVGAAAVIIRANNVGL